MKRSNFILSVLLIAFMIVSLVSGIEAEEQNNKLPEVKNVIYMIGDGMGLAQVQHAQWYYLGAYEKLNMQKMPVIGLASTYSSNRGVTDSAAAGTALATGFKTKNGVIGLDPNGNKLKNIMEAAKEVGKSTGIVVTSTVTDATPAAFYAHVQSRSSHEDIALELVGSNLDVILGGGRKFFLPENEGGTRTDKTNLIVEMQRKQYTYVKNIEQMESVKSGKLLGLFKDGDLSTPYPVDNSGVEPTIEQMTRKAIEILSSNPNGFVLMIEGSKIDKVAHSNNQDNMMKETLLFDNAVKAALEFAEKDGNTLVIVTADHETGGLSLAEATIGKGSKQPAQWATTSHTAIHVPIYAYGPGAFEFTGMLDNTDIPRKLAKMLQLKDFAEGESIMTADEENKTSTVSEKDDSTKEGEKADSNEGEVPEALENASFEKGTTVGWYCGFTAISDPLTFVVEPSFEDKTNLGKITGFQLNRTWQLYNTGSETGEMPFSVAVKEGDKYVIKAWMYGKDSDGNKSGTVSFSFQFIDKNGDIVNVNHKGETKNEVKQTIGFKGNAGDDGVYYCEVSFEENKIVFKRNFGGTPREEYAQYEKNDNISKMIVKLTGSHTTGSPLAEFYIDDFSITKIIE